MSLRTPELYFSRTGFISHSPYCVIIRASDKTVEIANSTPAEATICLIADVSKVHEADRTLIVPQALRSNSGLTSKKRNKNVKYLSDSDQTSSSSSSVEDVNVLLKKAQMIFYPREVNLSRQATDLYRVVQPTHMRDLGKSAGLKFRISNDQTGALGITSEAGIVYVKNATVLRASSNGVYK